MGIGARHDEWKNTRSQEGALFGRVLAFVHLLAKAEGAHISPHLADELQTLGLASGFASVPPAEWKRSVGGPDRILLFMIYYCHVNRFVFTVVHLLSPYLFFKLDFVLTVVTNLYYSSYVPDPVSHE
jgi:hypothetical protein